MSECHGCGGVIGRDCFNPQECEQITRSMAEEYQRTCNAPMPTVIPHSDEFDEAELRLRQDIEEAIEQAADCLHDATSWWAKEENGPRTIETLIGMIVVAAKEYKCRLDKTSNPSCSAVHFKRGDIIRNKGTGNSYVVIDIVDGHVVAARTVEAYNSIEWENVKPRQRCRKCGGEGRYEKASGGFIDCSACNGRGF